MKIQITIFQHENKTFSFLKANYTFYNYFLLEKFLDQKEVYDQTIRTSLIITGFIESLIKDK